MIVLRVLLMFDYSNITNYYLHCDWGWGGFCNGYFEGDVLAISNINRTYQIDSYFTVKNEGTYE